MHRPLSMFISTLVFFSFESCNKKSESVIGFSASIKIIVSILQLT